MLGVTGSVTRPHGLLGEEDVQRQARLRETKKVRRGNSVVSVGGRVRECSARGFDFVSNPEVMTS